MMNKQNMQISCKIILLIQPHGVVTKY